VLGALAIRVVMAGRDALAAGDDWMQRGRTIEAIRAYETAARWYFPLAPHVDDAYAKLRTIAEQTSGAKTADPKAEAAQAAVTLAAWRAIRSAARATRSLWTPHADDLAAADAAIATLSSAVRKPSGDPTAEATPPSWHRERLAREQRLGVGTAALAGFGILLWIGGAIALVRRGIGPAGQLVRRTAIPAGIAILLGVGLWFAGLYNA
jgi:hypothetical protein